MMQLIPSQFGRALRNDEADDLSTETLAATYAFAAPSSAKYLTQFIDAHISWVNHAPSHMLSKYMYHAA